VFAADRFYLGYIVSGVFKLLTIGGLGLVYVIDIILILLGWLGPSDNAIFP
jgi:TM2 domain-containing membrane protein YozV